MNLYLTVLHLLILFISCAYFEMSQKSLEPRILSRKRRYLTFPEGSSLQLVYCLTMPSLGMGRIFTIGSTAAMAWELPHEPMIFLDKKKKKISHRIDADLESGLPMYYRNASKNEYKNDYSSPYVRRYHRKGFYDTTLEDSKYFNFNGYDRNVKPYANYGYISGGHPTKFHHFVQPEFRQVYRRTRRDLYGKLQKLLNALSRDGRACILKIICEVSKVASRKGSFMEEIVKVLFRIKTHHNMENEDEYDTAFNRNHNCTELYESCPESLFGTIF
ncbi:hypothetical protein HHI36_003378 [Cryptolaemus montrouzieri]|uniref:Uncharacterized protein n=1 Tax=Cryptolaemus montrouzieri TaxID=559131 RepID=A0ABD2PD80_9CUCU